jgi:16S rRNA (guanine(966)-N(2))-methyltransferase RsmD
VRIIAGEFRSRRLQTPKDAETVRPIPDRVKESLFSLLRGHCEGARVLDLFSGTGAIGLEAVSRGAAKVVMVERDRDVADLLRSNIASLGVEDRTEVFVGDALGVGALARCPAGVTLAFLDPPYPVVRTMLGFKRVMNQVRQVITRMSPGGFLVLRTPWPLLLEEADAAEDRGHGGGGGRGNRSSRRGADRKNDRAKGARRGKHMLTPDEIESAQADDDDPWLDDAEAEVGEGDDASSSPSPVASPVRVPADLKLEIAQGPETHVYHAMAVHLYMPAAGRALGGLGGAS